MAVPEICAEILEVYVAFDAAIRKGDTREPREITLNFVTSRRNSTSAITHGTVL